MDLIQFDINWWAFLVVLSIAMITGAIWFAKGVFGRAWMGLIGKTEEELKSEQVSSLFMMLILSAVMVFSLANVVRWSSAETIAEGLLVGFLIWFVFLFAPVAASAKFAQGSKKLMMIEAGFYLIPWVIGGAIFASWV